MNPERVEIIVDTGALDALEERLRRISQLGGGWGGGGGGGYSGGGGGGGGWGPGGGPGPGGGGGNRGGGGGGGWNLGGGFGGVATAFAGDNDPISAAIRKIPLAGDIMAASLDYQKQAFGTAVAVERAQWRARAYGWQGGGGYGFNPMEAGGIGQSLYSAAGIGEIDPGAARMLWKTATAFERGGIQASSVGVYLSQFAAGGGGAGAIGGRYLGFNPSQESIAGSRDQALPVVLNAAVASGMRAGIESAKLGEYLQALVAETQRTSRLGMERSAISAISAQNSLSDVGFTGMQGISAMTGIRQAIGGQMGQVFTPAALTGALNAYLKPTGDRDYRLKLEALMGDDDAMGAFAQWAASQYGPELSGRFMMDLFEMGASQAEVFQQAKFKDGANISFINPADLTKGVPYGLQASEAARIGSEASFGARKETIQIVRLLQNVSQGAAQGTAEFLQGAIDEGWLPSRDTIMKALNPMKTLKKGAKDWINENIEDFDIFGILGDQSRASPRIEIMNSTGRPISARTLDGDPFVVSESS